MMIRPLCLFAALMLLAPGCIEFQRAFSGQGSDDGGVDFGPVATADGEGGGDDTADGGGDGAGGTEGNNTGADGASDGATGDGATDDGGNGGSSVGDTGSDADDATGDEPGDMEPADDGAVDDDMGDVDVGDEMDDDMGDDTEPDRVDEPTDGIPVLPEGLETTTTETGLQIIIIEEGEGELASPLDVVHVDYTGWIEADERLFDTSLDGNDPFRFTLGAGQVIDGWEEGILGMLVGESRRLIIPSDLAYGETGFADLIPPNATLVFDVTLVEVENDKPADDGEDQESEGDGTGTGGGGSSSL